jgi:hypothetical protein
LHEQRLHMHAHFELLQPARPQPVHKRVCRPTAHFCTQMHSHERNIL